MKLLLAAAEAAAAAAAAAVAAALSDDGSDGPAERDDPEFAFGVFNYPSTSRDTPFWLFIA